MLLNVIFNNISLLSWRSVLLVKETGEHDEDGPMQTYISILSKFGAHV